MSAMVSAGSFSARLLIRGPNGVSTTVTEGIDGAGRFDDSTTSTLKTGIAFGAASAALLAVGLIWLFVEHRRVRGIEDRWYAEHPEAHRQRPSS